MSMAVTFHRHWLHMTRKGVEQPKRRRQRQPKKQRQIHRTNQPLDLDSAGVVGGGVVPVDDGGGEVVVAADANDNHDSSSKTKMMKLSLRLQRLPPPIDNDSAPPFRSSSFVGLFNKH